jgi:hypothetical protein
VANARLLFSIPAPTIASTVDLVIVNPSEANPNVWTNCIGPKPIWRSMSTTSPVIICLCNLKAQRIGASPNHIDWFCPHRFEGMLSAAGISINFSITGS